MNYVPLVEVMRGNQIESMHAGSVAVVNTRGDLLYLAGDPHVLTFTRSTIKPFQAAPFLRDGGAAHFDYSTREIALLCASHSGEAMHTDVVHSMLRKAGCEEHHLRCGCHVPLYCSILDERPAADEVFNQLHHNCSGKHSGFLAYCVQHGYSLDSYLDSSHPLQQEVKKSVAYFAGLPAADLKMGIDGCSAPNYALPLSRLAFAYAQLAQGDQDTVYGSALNDLYQAMTTHPELVSGSGRSDLAFMQNAPGDWVAKIGAEGVQAIGSRSAGLGIAIKIADGNARALYPATLSVLQQLGLLSSSQALSLASWMMPKINNHMGLETGEMRSVVRITKSRQ